jgi:hypothetical protein
MNKWGLQEAPHLEDPKQNHENQSKQELTESRDMGKIVQPEARNQSQISIQGWSSQFALNLFQTSDQIYLTTLHRLCIQML